jgi:hypothetical protein
MGSEGVGMDEQRSGNDLFLAPNPTSGTVWLKMVLEGEVIITIYDAIGRPIKSDHKDGSSLLDHEIRLDDVPAGLYTVVVRSAREVVSGRVVKE